jgi:hypothetical protein
VAREGEDRISLHARRLVPIAVLAKLGAPILGSD